MSTFIGNAGKNAVKQAFKMGLVIRLTSHIENLP